MYLVMLEQNLKKFCSKVNLFNNDNKHKVLNNSLFWYSFNFSKISKQVEIFLENKILY